MPLRLQPRNAEAHGVVQAVALGKPYELVARYDAFHCGEHAAGCEKVPRPAHELPGVGERTRDDDIELFLGLPGLDAVLDHGGVIELQLADGLTQERRLLLVRVEQRDLQTRTRDRERNPGETGAATDVQRPPRGSDVGNDGKAVE